MDLEQLRKECKMLLVELELDKRGNGPRLAGILKVNRRSLNMALSGYRNSPGSASILTNLKDYLEELKSTKTGRAQKSPRDTKNIPT
jgi:hypothetical protein